MRVLLAVLVCFSGCATVIESSWRSPDATANPIKTVVVFGQGASSSARIAFEESLTDALKARGLAVQPGYAFVAYDEKLERPQIIERLRAKNVDGVLVTRIIGRDERTSTTPVWVGATMLDPFYGGWYGYYGLTTVGGFTGYTTESVEYTIETVLYALEDTRPIWAARSITTRRSPVAFGRDIADRVATELKGLGVAGR